MTITIQVTAQEAEIMQALAKAQNRSVSEIIRGFTLEKIEDELDLQAYIQAMTLHEQVPQTSSFDEVWGSFDNG